MTGPDKDPGLVRFWKTTGKAIQLDQIAQWLPARDGWAPGRWRPVGGPKLPKWLVERIEAKLRGAAPAPAVIEAPALQQQAPAVAPRQLAFFA